jgi:hypothetical protein
MAQCVPGLALANGDGGAGVESCFLPDGWEKLQHFPPPLITANLPYIKCQRTPAPSVKYAAKIQSYAHSRGQDRT